MLLTPDQSRALYEHATTENYALLAVNADSPAALTDCLEAAATADAPLIIETSLWQLTGRSFGADDAILGMTRYLLELAALAHSERFQGIPVIFHTDHIKGPLTESILTAAIRGIPVTFHKQEQLVRASSLSLDSSELTPAENISLMTKLCQVAEEAGQKATLEMEAGVDKGVSPITDTKEVFGAVEKQHPGHLALWAPGVGTQHGLASGNAVDPAAIRQHQTMASELCGRPIGLALHGSSGLSDEALREAVEAGTAKVNWSSESLLLRSQAARDYFTSHADKLQKEHPDFKITAMDNGLQSFVSEIYIPKVTERIRTLGGDGKAGVFMATLH